ncbi:NAD(P)-dependent dehydrogenase (short-subunit alcohol dehydrogenase family) [Kitasatospora sp. MAP12-15]|uniref:SDR family NAD(P)-dependent oxidoreductase n=1 Tax=unclassified Kitasatospora TaxID=2633591 RepID=UPI0024768287|nr:SDR family oxidoreductase [Kitasatospora sp. MAP12-44]MDH6114195.1 NAD(P)-dependent dehydrogenase (short-subunit alcohol dehydrogenase family) [Kitasatospora sp. MAP12-44]
MDLTDPTPRPAASARPVAVVTGASRGLGLELARSLAEDGWQLVITARDGTELSAAEAALSRLTTVTALPGSVVDDDHRADLAEAAARLGGAELLINNASTLTGYDLAGAALPTLAEFPLPGLLETFEVNVLAPIALTQLLLPQLRSHGGTVINLSSDAAVEAYPGWGGYGASKAALDHASAVLAVEEPQLRVWSVDPGDLRTRMHQEAFPGEDISDRPLPATVVPAFRALLRERPGSGRYRAADLRTPAGS